MTMQLSQQDRQNLKEKGYSDQDIDKAVGDLQMDNLKGSFDSTQQARSDDPRNNSVVSSFGAKPEDNLIKFQLELNDILEKAEHILNGDIATYKNGSEIWESNPTPKLNTLNKIGVRAIMQRLAMYINRNTILSDFTQDEISERSLEFGKALNNLIFMKYEEFGIDNDEKMKDYPMMVLEITDMVNASLKRALDGGERISLRQMIQIQQSTQTQGYTGGTNIYNTPQQKSRGLLNPLRYLGGKNK